jgi:hypothetical protein
VENGSRVYHEPWLLTTGQRHRKDDNGENDLDHNQWFSLVMYLFLCEQDWYRYAIKSLSILQAVSLVPPTDYTIRK